MSDISGDAIADEDANLLIELAHDLEMLQQEELVDQDQSSNLQETLQDELVADPDSIDASPTALVTDLVSAIGFEIQAQDADIRCDCGEHAIHLHHDVNTGEIEMAFWQHGSRVPGLYYRLMAMWHILWHGTPFADMVVLEPRNISKLTAFLEAAQQDHKNKMLSLIVKNK